jgi:hypothetical protein
MNKPGVFLLMVLPTGAGCAAALAQSPSTVYYKDQVLTQNARSIGGHTYVPLSDVAKALSCQVAARGHGYALVAGSSSGTPAGGANQLAGTVINVGQWTFTGKWRFRVNTVTRPDSYSWTYYDGTGSDNPSRPSDQLIVFNCSLKNGQQRSDEPILTYHSDANTSLTDDQGNSYSPIDIDAASGSLIQGAQKSFAVVFSVPKTANISQFVFSVMSYSSDNPINVRVNVPAP